MFRRSLAIRPDRGAKFDDYTAVTGHVRRLVDEMQDSPVECDAAAVETFDEPFGRFDEWVTVFTIDESRDSSWRTAVAMNSRRRVRR